MLRVVISNIIIRPQLTLLTNKCVYQFIEDQKSMISNLLNCRSLSTTFSYYASIKPFMLPRTTSLLSRRLVHLLIPINISYLQYRDKQIFKQIVQDIIHIEYKMLIPSECLSVLFFIYTLKDSLKRLQIDEQKLKKLELSLINQIMVNIESVNFNNLVDLVALFRNNEGSEENIKIIFKNLQKTFPLHESDQKDSFYHITRLLSIIVQQQKSLIAVLLKKVSDSIIKYDQYLPKYMLVDSINILLGKFSSLRIQPQLSESINLLLISLMTNLANKASMLEGAQFSHVVMCIKRLAKQIEEGNEVSKQSIANTAVEINKLKKIYYRQSQIRLTQKQKFYKLNPPNNPQDGNDFRLFKSKDSF